MDGVPPIGEPLAPYLKSREETLQIRRALTQHAAYQHLRLADNASPCHLTATTGFNIDSVKDVPAELDDSNFARYLRALRANVAARNEYKNAYQELSGLEQRKQRPSTKDDAPPKTHGLESYLSLLRARQEHEKMQIFRECLGRLDGMEAAQSDYLTAGEWSKPIDTSSTSNPDSNIPSEAAALGLDLDSIIQDLERSVLQAKRRVDVEQRKLQRVNNAMEQRKLSATTLAAVDHRVRYKALRCVRDELVQWVETMLADVAELEESKDPEEQSANLMSDNETPALDNKKAQIREQYHAYLAARQELLNAVADASSPLPTMSLKSRTSPTAATPSSVDPMVAPPAMLSYADRNLVPLSKAQKAAAMQRSFTSALLAKEKWDACRVLGRLQEESYLLPEYPILTKQARFKHAVAAISSRRVSVVPEPEPHPSSEIVEHAEAWAYASSAARDATNSYVTEQISTGTNFASTAEKTLRDIYTAINGDYDAAASAETEDGWKMNEDIWTTADTLSSRSRRRTLEDRGPGEKVASPWAGLRGKVGVSEDK